MKQSFIFTIIIIIFSSCKIPYQLTTSDKKNLQIESDSLRYENEIHIKNIKQLTFGGDNAEAYWSFDDSKLVFQAKNEKWGALCDQIYITKANNYNMGTEIPKQISTGFGRTTCSYFLPGDTNIIYASTHLADSLCPKEP